MSDLTSVRFVAHSRKSFYCDDCGKVVLSGSEYMRYYGGASVWNGKNVTLRYCRRCCERMQVATDLRPIRRREQRKLNAYLKEI